MKTTHRVMYKLTPNSIWGYDEYLSEEGARKEANNLWRQGFYLIELYSRVRNGWLLVKAVKTNEREAAAKHRAYLDQLAKEAGTTITFN